MTDDTIYRRAAIDALERKKDKNAKGDIGGFYNKIIQNDIDALMQLSSAQPEIVRCKDCKHHKDEEPGMVYCPIIVGGWVSEDCYCSWAERRE